MSDLRCLVSNPLSTFTVLHNELFSAWYDVLVVVVDLLADTRSEGEYTVHGSLDDDSPVDGQEWAPTAQAYVVMINGNSNPTAHGM